MNWVWMLGFYGVGLGLFIGFGCPIAIALGLVAIAGIVLRSGWMFLPTIGDILWNQGNSFTLVAIPMFILMGEIVLQTGLSQRFYRGLAVLLGRIPGGLAHANIIGCAMFSAISGSSVATGITMGQVALPELRNRNYDIKLSVGSLAAGGTLGILIPPSIPMIIYAVTVQVSILDLFMAGVVPGIMLSVLFMLWIVISIWRNPHLVPPVVREHVSGRTLLLALRDCLSFAILIILTIGSLYLGIVTPTEAGGFGALAAMLISLAYGELSLKRIWSALMRTVSTTSVVYYIIMAGALLSFGIVDAGIARGVSNLVVESHLSPLEFFLIVVLVYVVLGMLIEGVSMMLVTIPVLFPSIVAMGFDPIWFGVILVIFIEIGALTPPMGLNLFAIHSVAENVDLKTVIRGAFPFLCMMILGLVLLYLFPAIALWLPYSMH
ncbi:MAG: TRAP transporter large permease subunit [Planctomycetaceae bacterium]|nr:TRAP transporter large permease subunit [Planctomycetaceae bacterium]